MGERNTKLTGTHSVQGTTRVPWLTRTSLHRPLRAFAAIAG